MDDNSDFDTLIDEAIAHYEKIFNTRLHFDGKSYINLRTIHVKMLINSFMYFEC